MVGKNIKSFLKSKGIKQNFVANQIGMPATTLNSMLQERQKMDAETFIRICNLVGVSPCEFAPAVPEKEAG